jgi:hypothetical protein
MKVADLNVLGTEHLLENNGLIQGVLFCFKSNNTAKLQLDLYHIPAKLWKFTSTWKPLLSKMRYIRPEVPMYDPLPPPITRIWPFSSSSPYSL